MMMLMDKKIEITEREKKIKQVTLVGGVVNLILLISKFIAGIFGHSSAMIADAIHSLSDFVTDIVVLVFVHISGKPQDKDHDYGHGKYETLATTIIGIALLVVAAEIIIKGVVNIGEWVKGEDLVSPGMLAFWVAILSIVFKEAIYQYTVRRGHGPDSQALIANAWHHRSDAFSSIGTTIGIGGAILLGGRWAVLDPIASLVVSVFIIKVAVTLLRQGVYELMEGSLPDDVEDEIIGIVMSFPDVMDPHDLRTRRIGNHYAIELHVRMRGDISLSESHDRASEIERAIREQFGQHTHVTIHMEPLK